MDKTQLLSIELTTACNLGKLHAACPNQSSLRYRRVSTIRKLTDDVIINLIISMYRDHNFQGLVAWHYYNEPLCAADRMFKLMSIVKERCPQVRYLLWTNGILLQENPADRYKEFDRIIITDYGGLNRNTVDTLLAQQDGVSVHQWSLDTRLNIIGKETDHPCRRMFAEFIVDYFGNVHLCCFDWEGREIVGNVYTHTISSLVDKWQTVRDTMIGEHLSCSTPEVCWKCTHKASSVPELLQPQIAAPSAVHNAKTYVANTLNLQHNPPWPSTQDIRNDEEKSKPNQTKEPAKESWNPRHGERRIAIVLVSYLKVPKKRLRDHFKWNGYQYKKHNVSVYVVMDKISHIPKYAQCIVFPVEKLPVVDGQPRFSLCATKNAGIDAAIKDSAEVIICIDVDHAFPDSCFVRMCDVSSLEANIPVYRMVSQKGQREDSILDHGATGAIAMTVDNWRRIRWDERCVGYGADDGIILNKIIRTGLKLDRDAIIEHVEHPDATHEPNEPGHGRDGCYGRDDGFNFDNFEHNRQFNE